jgi:hypothetical protein
VRLQRAEARAQTPSDFWPAQKLTSRTAIFHGLPLDSSPDAENGEKRSSVCISI